MSFHPLGFDVSYRCDSIVSSAGQDRRRTKVDDQAVSVIWVPTLVISSLQYESYFDIGIAFE